MVLGCANIRNMGSNTACGIDVAGYLSEKFSDSTPSCQGLVQSILSLLEKTRYPRIHSQIKRAKNQIPERSR
jgi:hypothetical protein